MGKIITFGTLKGGVGKTTMCFNISGILAKRGKHVLVIDNDLQGNLTENMGVDRTEEGVGTAYDIYVSGKAIPEDLVFPQPVARLPSLDLIAGSIFLHKAELEIAHVAGREQILRNYLEDHWSFFSQYDYILIDTSPSMSIVNQNAFLASDTILLVGDISMNAIYGAQLFMALWEESRKRLRKEDNVRGFIINDFDARNKLSADYIEFLTSSDETEDLRPLVCRTIIPRTVRITESELSATPVVLYDPKSKASEAFLTLVDELAEKGIF